MDFFNILGKKKDEKEHEDVVPVLPEEIYKHGVLKLQDVIAPSALQITPKALNLGDKMVRTFFVISYPRFLTTGWFSPIINLDKVFDISIFVHPIDTTGILRKFQKKVAEIESQIAIRQEKGMVRDPKLDTAYSDLEYLRSQLQQAQEKIFNIGLYITIYGDSRDEIDKAETEIRSMLEARLVYLKPALFQQEQGFKSVMPIAKDELGVHSKLNSSPLSSIFPFMSFDLTSDRGILYGINRHNSSLVLFDRFSLENYNSVVFAKSGAGKSIRGNEPVLTRKDGRVSSTKIGPLVESVIREHGCRKIDEDLEGAVDPDLEVFSFDSKMKGHWSKVSVAARKEAPDVYYTFQTKSGREVTTTADHNMLVLRDGRVEAAKSEDVAVGEYTPLPRKLSQNNLPTFLNLLDLLPKNSGWKVKSAIDGHSRSFNEVQKEMRALPKGERNTFAHTATLIHRKKTFPALMPLDASMGALLGWLASEGTLQHDKLVISNIDTSALDSIEYAIKNIGLTYTRSKKDIRVYSTLFATLLQSIGAHGKSATKCVADPLFGAPQATLASYLRAYFEGDGGVEQHEVTAVSKSKDLISGLSYLLYRFGIIARVQKRSKKYAATGRKRTFWQLRISGQDNICKFKESIGFISTRKSVALAAIASKDGNTNVDIVPCLGSLALELDNLFGTQLVGITDLSVLKGGKDISPERLRRFTANVRERIERFNSLYNLMRQLKELPTIESVVERAKEEHELNQALIEAMSSSWFTVKQGMQPRAKNALKIFKTAGTSAPSSVSELKTLVAEGFSGTGTTMKGADAYLSVSLRGERDNSSYSLLYNAAQFAVGEYERVLSNLSRVQEIIATFETLAKSELFWDPIVSIKKKANKKDKYVYDLTVDNEVFLAGHAGMFVHNSYMMKLEIVRSLMFDADVIVIDPEREYEYLAETTGGRYFNISLSSQHHINPFDLPTPREDENPADVLRNNIITLVGLFRIIFGGITPEEDAIIDRAITETYALKDINAESDFTNMEPPLLSDFELVLSGMEGSESLVQRLSKYTHGTWSGFINRPTNVDMNKRFVVFSVRDMEDELKPVAMYLVTHYIWNAVRKNLRKRLLVIDEAWWMMKSEDTASFLFGIAKRGRKYYLGLATITQDVADFLGSPYGRAMITNSSIQILLRQSPTSIDLVQDTFKLSDEEKYLLLESDVGEGIFFAGLKHVAIKIIASYTEDQIITSDPSQILAIKKAKKDLEEAEVANDNEVTE